MGRKGRHERGRGRTMCVGGGTGGGAERMAARCWAICGGFTVDLEDERLRVLLTWGIDSKDDIGSLEIAWR